MAVCVTCSLLGESQAAGTTPCPRRAQADTGWLPRAPLDATGEQRRCPPADSGQEAVPSAAASGEALSKRRILRWSKATASRRLSWTPFRGPWSGRSGQASRSGSPGPGRAQSSPKTQSSVSGWTPRMACSSSGVKPSKFCRSQTKRYT